MAHLSTSTTRAGATPPEWLALGAQLAAQANAWAEREDIVGYVGPGAGSGSPACFKPSIAEMELNLDVALGEGVLPEWVGDFTRRKTHFEYPKAAGAVLHEAAHARWSLWNLEALHRHPNKNLVKVVEFFEETRIEGLARKTFPRNRSFLRSCAIAIVLSDLDYDEIKERKGLGLSFLLLLSLARVDARVLEAEDVAPIREIAEAVFGKDLLETLRSIWVKAQAHVDHTSAEPLIELAQAWLDALAEAGAISEEAAEGKPEAGFGEPGGEGGGTGNPALDKAIMDAIEEMLEAMEEASADAEMGAAEEAAEQELGEMREAQVAAQNADTAERKEHEREMTKIFAKGTGPTAATRTSSRLIERRPPKPSERAAAVKVGQLLEKARYSDRIVTPTKSVLPPGRLDTRSAIQGMADIAVSGFTGAAPWHGKRRRHVEDPTLQIGYLVDISGSMGGAMMPMAVSAWVFSEAARRIQAKAAMVYYGEGVFPVLKPGQHLPEVVVYSAPDGTERFNTAFKAVDGALNLLHGSGARVLVISSDMHYTSDEARHAQRWIGRCIKAGVAVVIMSFDSSRGHYDAMYEKLGATFIRGAMTPEAAAIAIGQAAAQAITRAGARNA